MTKRAAFSISAKNYTGQMITLKKSMDRFAPGVDFFGYVCDEIPDALSDERWLRPLDDLAIHRLEEKQFTYNVTEFCTFVKPFVFSKLLEDYDEVLYLDPDLVAFGPAGLVFEEFKNGKVLLTPHYLVPEVSYTGIVRETEILFVGIFNCGFVGVSRGDRVQLFLEWWMARLEDQCYADKLDALHVDQKWMDFAPTLFPDLVHIVRNPGINAAFFNLHEKTISRTDAGYQVELRGSSAGPTPLLLFHFSGFNPERPEILHSRDASYSVVAEGVVRDLFEDYGRRLNENRFRELIPLGYSWNQFDSGEPVLPFHRRIVRVLIAEGKNNFSSYFCQDDSTGFYQYLRRRRLLLKAGDSSAIKPKAMANLGKKQKLVKKALRLLRVLVGIKFYYFFLSYMMRFGRFESQVEVLTGSDSRMP